MNEAFSRLVERDANFIEQFQTTGFNTRTFELYVSELLHSERFCSIGREPQPDFTVSKNGIEISIECTTVNPTGNEAGFRAYRAISENELSASEIRARLEDQLPIRYAAALRAKMAHRLDKRNAGGKAYWELPHVAGKPFMLAIQTFHESGALLYSNVSMIRYLYGLTHTPSWDSDENLVIQTDRVQQHKFGEKIIESGFFDLDGSENVSAVLWTNSGTVPKFTRMALAGPYPDGDLTMLRFGNMIDHDRNAHLPLPFAYIVGDAGDSPTERWGTGANIFHNPNAKHPIPLDLFETVTDSTCVNGNYVDRPKEDYIPITSISHTLVGPGHRAAGRLMKERILEHGLQDYSKRLEERSTAK